MTRRLPILILVAIAAVSVAVPAFAQPTEVAPKLDSDSAVRALAKARLALLTARSAKSESRRAARTAQAALNAANEAKNTSKGATGPAGASAAPVQSGSASAKASTTSESYVSLSGGPSVTVEVPSSGLIEVWAQVTIEETGAVGLFEDGSPMPGQSEFCGPEEGPGGDSTGLIASFVSAGPGEETTLATPSGFAFGPFCGSSGPPAPVLFQTSPGKHTYELRYGFPGCGCGEPESTFSKRSLFVGPRL